MKTIRLLLLVALGWLALPASVLAFYNPSTGRWLSRDPIGELAFRTQYLLSVEAEKQDWVKSQALNNPFVFALNDAVACVDGDGAFVPVISIFMYGKAVNNVILACYDCYQLNKCLTRCRATAEQAAKGIKDADAYLKWVSAAKPCQECTELLTACGKDILFVAVWAGGRYLLLKYYAGGHY